MAVPGCGEHVARLRSRNAAGVASSLQAISDSLARVIDREPDLRAIQSIIVRGNAPLGRLIWRYT
jgi:hypothetical protein